LYRPVRWVLILSFQRRRTVHPRTITHAQFPAIERVFVRRASSDGCLVFEGCIDGEAVVHSSTREGAICAVLRRVVHDFT
jgi:hypothetical protein